MRAQIEIERAENKAHDLEVDLATKYYYFLSIFIIIRTVYINELNEKLNKHSEENKQLAAKLLDTKTLLVEYETRIRLYPAVQILKQAKMLVHVFNYYFSF